MVVDGHRDSKYCFSCTGALGQFRDRTDLTLRAVDFLGNGDPAQVLTLAGFHLGPFVGDLTDPRPADGPRAA
jgi:hypothetical protein